MEKQQFTCSVIPVGTKLYTVKNDKIVEYEIIEFSVRVNHLKENYILYKTKTETGFDSFVQPIEGKFHPQSNVNMWTNIGKLSATREEAVEAFLNKIGIQAHVQLSFD